ncbi:PAS domain-containing sensor histidine kinase [Texcoconibacillus texcoconensis]|uniref:histidine kinase n=1 Tax=Texcoconibacillus texcoconensis TaxID=1095777 RepID=A0A840QPM6_9BACI|nr:PAS domain-containing sensor histidine kinase [Texcoconibacillus texcoconensis]MBB5173320.1 PAS domain S-box-containing protein [Texcoconibacillus texcoconensis]
MNKWLPQGLTQRFFLLGLSFVVIPLTIIIVITIIFSQNTLQNQADEQTMQGAETMSDKAQQLFYRHRDLLEMIAGDYIEHGNSDLLIDRLESQMLSDPFFAGIAYYDEDGELLLEDPHVDENIIEVGESILESMRWRRSTFVVSEQVGEEVAVFMAIPVQPKEHGEIDGMILARTNPEYLSNAFQVNKIGEEGRSFLVTDTGEIFVDTHDNELVGERLTDTDYEVDLRLGRMGVYRETLQEEDVLIGFYPIDRLPISAATLQPVSQANAPITTMTVVLAFGWFVIFLFGLMLLSYGARWVIEPVKRITDQAVDYARGESWHMNILKEDDEIRTLEKTMKHMAEGLQEKQRFLQLILESFPYGVIATSPNETITSLNRSGARVLGINQNIVSGKSLDILPSRGLKNHIQGLDFPELQQNQVTNEFTYVNHEGRKLIVKTSSSPLLDENGRVIGIITTFWDHTEREQLEQHLQRSEQLAAIGQMTAGLAHEVKNPLSTVQMASDVIDAEFQQLKTQHQLQGPDVSMVDEALSDIQEETKRLSELVSRFLRMSKSRKNEEKLININQLVTEVVKLVKHQLNQSGIDHAVMVAEQDVCVLGDRNQLVQALLNILLNAKEALKGEKHPYLQVKVQKQESEIQIIIIDNGCGISTKKLNRIFNPFFSTKQEGTGLGLSITHDIIRDHQGQIEVDSEIGHGTEFKLTLPVSECHKGER